MNIKIFTKKIVFFMIVLISITNTIGQTPVFKTADTIIKTSSPLPDSVPSGKLFSFSWTLQDSIIDPATDTSSVEMFGNFPLAINSSFRLVSSSVSNHIRTTIYTYSAIILYDGSFCLYAKKNGKVFLIEGKRNKYFGLTNCITMDQCDTFTYEVDAPKVIQTKTLPHLAFPKDSFIMQHYYKATDDTILEKIYHKDSTWIRFEVSTLDQVTIDLGKMLKDTTGDTIKFYSSSWAVTNGSIVTLKENKLHILFFEKGQPSLGYISMTIPIIGINSKGNFQEIDFFINYHLNPNIVGNTYFYSANPGDTINVDVLTAILTKGAYSTHIANYDSTLMKVISQKDSIINIDWSNLCGKNCNVLVANGYLDSAIWYNKNSMSYVSTTFKLWIKPNSKTKSAYISKKSTNTLNTLPENDINSELVVIAPSRIAGVPDNVAKINIEIKNSTAYTSMRNAEVDNLLVYPNPATNKLFVQGNYDKEHIFIYTPTGQLVLSDNISSEINISSLQKGLYFLKIKNNVYKIIKE